MWGTAERGDGQGVHVSRVCEGPGRLVGGRHSPSTGIARNPETSVPCHPDDAAAGEVAQLDRGSVGNVDQQAPDVGGLGPAVPPPSPPRDVT